MYRCESWTIEKAECQRIVSFELWCWRRLSWTSRRSNQSILKEINLEYSLERLMLKVKLQYLAIWCKELSHWKRPLCLERLRARGKGGKVIGWYHQLNGHKFEHTLGDSEGQGSLMCCSPWGHKELGMVGQLNNDKRNQGCGRSPWIRLCLATCT